MGFRWAITGGAYVWPINESASDNSISFHYQSWFMHHPPSCVTARFCFWTSWFCLSLTRSQPACGRHHANGEGAVCHQRCWGKHSVRVRLQEQPQSSFLKAAGVPMNQTSTFNACRCSLCYPMTGNVLHIMFSSGHKDSFHAGKLMANFKYI